MARRGDGIYLRGKTWWLAWSPPSPRPNQPTSTSPMRTSISASARVSAR